MIVKDHGAGKCFACGKELGPDGKGEDYIAIGNKYIQETKFSNENTVLAGPDGSKKYTVKTETQTSVLLTAKASGKMCDACHDLYHNNELIARERGMLIMIASFFMCFMYLWHSPGFLGSLISPDGFFTSCLKAVLFAVQAVILAFGAAAVVFVPLLTIGFVLALFEKEERRVDAGKYLAAFLKRDEPSLDVKNVDDGAKHLSELLESRGIKGVTAREAFIASLFDDKTRQYESEGYKRISREYKVNSVCYPLSASDYAFFKATDAEVSAWKDAEACDIDLRRKTWGTVVKTGVAVALLAALAIILGALFGNGGEAIFNLFRGA